MTSPVRNRCRDNLWYPVATPTGIREMRYYKGFLWESSGAPFGSVDGLIIRSMPEWLEVHLTKLKLNHGTVRH